MPLTKTEREALKAVPSLVDELKILNGHLAALLEAQLQTHAALQAHQAAMLKEAATVSGALSTELKRLVKAVQGTGNFSDFEDGLRSDERRRIDTEKALQDSLEDPLKYPEDLPQHPTQPGPHPIDPEHEDNLVDWPDGNL